MNRRSFLAGVLGIGGAGCVLGSEAEPAAPGLTYTGTGEPVRTSEVWCTECLSRVEGWHCFDCSRHPDPWPAPSYEVEGKPIEYQMHLNSVPTWSGTFNEGGEVTWTMDSPWTSAREFK